MQQKSIAFITKLVFVILFAILSNSKKSIAYSLLTHEAIIDVSWKKSIEPLLLQKYPGSNAEQLVTAHAYAYGGAIMPDIGYSPFGSMLYTNLVHHVRTGNYILALLEEAENINEYAFALVIYWPRNARRNLQSLKTARHFDRREKPHHPRDYG